jgi:hypothetical protein
VAGVDAVSHPNLSGARYPAGRRGPGAVDGVWAAVATTAPKVCPPCKHKSPCLSLLRIGILYVAKLALLIYLGVRCIQAHLPPPRLRSFLWLEPSSRLHKHAKRSEISADTPPRRATTMPVGLATAPVAVSS